MFTGIVEELGSVDALERHSDAARLTVRAPHVLADAALGDSISVNGCCLTVATRDQETFTADVMSQTLDLTGLGGLAVGDRVNLERAVQASGRLGGHLVSGHVDAVGQVLTRTPSEHWDVVRVSLPADLARFVVPQGSITVDGVSLTVVEAAPDSFTVSLIPETLARTTLGARQPGEQVNLEVDTLAKLVDSLLEHAVARHVEHRLTEVLTPLLEARLDEAVRRVTERLGHTSDPQPEEQP